MSIGAVGVQRKVEVASVMIKGRLCASLIQGSVDLRLRHPGPAFEAVIRSCEGGLKIVVTIIGPGLARL